MSDEDLLWTAQPPAPRKPLPGDKLWTMLKGTRAAECELRYHGEYGVEAQIYRDGEFFASRRFNLKAQALQWAELEKQELEREGWVLHTASGGRKDADI